MEKNYTIIRSVIATFLFATVAISLKAQTDSVEEYKPESRLQVTVAYASYVLSAGRDYGVEQYGIFPSIAYKHKSGFSASISGCWLSQADPQYTSTALSLGYGKDINKHWAFNTRYSHSFFNPDSAGIIKNSIGGGVDYMANWFSSGISYSYLFGEDEKGHQLVAYIGSYFEKTTNSFIESISIAPGINALFGTANIPFNQLPVRQYYTGTGTTWKQFRETLRSRWQQYAEDASNQYEFGLMNWNFSLPLTLTIKNFDLTLGYTYSIPVQLPDEEQAPQAKGFFDFSIGYTIR